MSGLTPKSPKGDLKHSARASFNPHLGGQGGLNQ
jgi:hypothetical protein